jgi:DNA-binding NarL/FixJ family response regulator
MAIVVAVAGAGDIVTEGLRHILGQAPDLEVIHDYSPDLARVGVLPDVVLYDAVGVQRAGCTELAELVDAHEGAVVVVGRDLRPDLAARAMARGAAGCVSLEAPASEVLSIIRQAATGQLCPDSTPTALGGEAQLSAREAEILGDIVQGFTNAEIARRHCLSLNTVKSYVRTTYRKVGVATRSQAVSWGLQRGFEPGDVPQPGQTRAS